MKGTLHKIERGWVVKQLIKEGPIAKLINQYPLIDNGHIDGLMLYDSNEGLEVEFEIVDFPSNSISKYAKLVSKEYLVTAPWITMKEGDITVNFKPMPEFDDPKYPDYPTRAQQLHIQIAEECFKKYPNNKELYTTDELIDAYKAGVIDGFKEAQNYNPPTKKQE